jgi:hypothetical protein
MGNCTIIAAGFLELEVAAVSLKSCGNESEKETGFSTADNRFRPTYHFFLNGNA